MAILVFSVRLRLYLLIWKQMAFWPPFFSPRVSEASHWKFKESGNLLIWAPGFKPSLSILEIQSLLTFLRARRQVWTAQENKKECKIEVMLSLMGRLVTCRMLHMQKPAQSKNRSVKAAWLFTRHSTWIYAAALLLQDWIRLLQHMLLSFFVSARYCFEDLLSKRRLCQGIPRSCTSTQQSRNRTQSVDLPSRCTSRTKRWDDYNWETDMNGRSLMALQAGLSFMASLLYLIFDGMRRHRLLKI